LNKILYYLKKYNIVRKTFWCSDLWMTLMCVTIVSLFKKIIIIINCMLSRISFFAFWKSFFFFETRIWLFERHLYVQRTKKLIWIIPDVNRYSVEKLPLKRGNLIVSLILIKNVSECRAPRVFALKSQAFCVRLRVELCAWQFSTF